MGINISVGPVYATYKCNDMNSRQIFDVTAIIRTVTSARPEGYRFMPAFKRGTWDGYIQLTKGIRFPAGLTGLVIDALRNMGFDAVGISNDFDTPKIDWDVIRPDMFPGITLRQYQVQAASKLLFAGRGIAKMATNSGKTEVIAALAKAVRGEVLVLVTKKDLLYQTAERLGMRLGENIGVVGDGNLGFDRVTVGMIQTLTKRLDDRLVQARLKRLGCVMFDECHHIPSKTAQQVMFAIPAPLRFGFSGTPLSYTALADLILVGATEEIRVEITNDDLISAGISATPTVTMYTIKGNTNQKVSYQEAYEEEIVCGSRRNNLISIRAKRAFLGEVASTLILVDRLEHGKLLQDKIPGSVFVNGSDSIEQRKRCLDWLREGSSGVVIATPIFEEGVDIPAVDLLILAGGGKGHKRLLQRVGRGMRKKGGDNVLTVVDFFDETNKYLLDHSNRRKEIYEGEGFEVIVK